MVGAVHPEPQRAGRRIGNRDLFDDFGVAASPATGLASITNSDDQYADNTGTANAGECTRAQDNTAACDHTDYATQTSGHGIY